MAEITDQVTEYNTAHIDETWNTLQKHEEQMERIGMALQGLWQTVGRLENTLKDLEKIVEEFQETYNNHWVDYHKPTPGGP